MPLLDGLLDPSAAALYQRLLAGGGLPLADHPELADSAELRELIDRGFARKRYVDEPAVIPVEPARAVENALLVTQRRILEQQRMLVRVREQMGQLQRSYVAGRADPDGSAAAIELLTDPAEIVAFCAQLCLSAERDFSTLETGQYKRVPDPRPVNQPPAEVLHRGVRFRNIAARAALEQPGTDAAARQCQAGGWQMRVVPALPMKMVLVDECTALLPLDPTVTEGALVIRAPVILAMLRSYFELLWARAVPLGQRHSRTRLGGVQDRVLRLMLSGMTDASMARHLCMSERTVRRHVAAIQEVLGVDNRMAAAVVAVREGWVD